MVANFVNEKLKLELTLSDVFKVNWQCYEHLVIPVKFLLAKNKIYGWVLLKLNEVAID